MKNKNITFNAVIAGGNINSVCLKFQEASNGRLTEGEIRLTEGENFSFEI